MTRLPLVIDYETLIIRKVSGRGTMEQGRGRAAKTSYWILLLDSIYALTSDKLESAQMIVVRTQRTVKKKINTTHEDQPSERTPSIRVPKIM